MWQIAVASGNNFAAAPALAIDNVEIEGQLPPVPVYDWHIYMWMTRRVMHLWAHMLMER